MSKTHQVIMDVDKQIAYWQTSGNEDLAAARELLQKGHNRHALFFAQLALEKILKAHFVRTQQQLPPRIHDLLRLAELAGVTLTDDRRAFLARFQRYCLAARYPDDEPAVILSDEAKQEHQAAQETFTWLRKQLS